MSDMHLNVSWNLNELSEEHIGAIGLMERLGWMWIRSLDVLGENSLA